MVRGGWVVAALVSTLAAGNAQGQPLGVRYEFDRFEGDGTWVLDATEVHAEELDLEMIVAGSVMSGHKRLSPSRVSIMVGLRHHESEVRYADCSTLILLANGHPVRPSYAFTREPPEGDGEVTIAFFTLSDLVRLASAKQVEGRLCRDEFLLNRPQIAGLRQLRSAVARGPGRAAPMKLARRASSFDPQSIIAPVGVSQCDAYMNAMNACAASMSPEARAPMLRSLRTMATAWRDAASTEYGRTALAEGCGQALTAAREAYGELGCKFETPYADEPSQNLSREQVGYGFRHRFGAEGVLVTIMTEGSEEHPVLVLAWDECADDALRELARKHRVLFEDIKAAGFERVACEGGKSASSPTGIFGSSDTTRPEIQLP